VPGPQGPEEHTDGDVVGDVADQRTEQGRHQPGEPGHGF